MRSMLALVVGLTLSATACSGGTATSLLVTTLAVVPPTVAASDPAVSPETADLVLVHRVRGECPMGVCQETFVWSDGYFRTSEYDQATPTEGQVDPSIVAAVMDVAALGELKAEPVADAGCQPEVDDIPDEFLVAVAIEEAARRLSWCRHAGADLPPAWGTLDALVNEIGKTPTQPAAAIMLLYSLTGGCGMTGSCTTTTIDETGRRWAVAPLPFDEGHVALHSSHADPDDVDRLIGLIGETDFAALRALLGEGVCNGCVDGIDFAFDFVGVGEVLDSVTYDVSPANHPLLELVWAVAE
jgi:hypothetical protein